jgi:hypothetical protein
MSGMVEVTTRAVKMEAPGQQQLLHAHHGRANADQYANRHEDHGF